MKNNTSLFCEEAKSETEFDFIFGDAVARERKQEMRYKLAPESNLKNQLSFPEEQATNRVSDLHC